MDCLEFRRRLAGEPRSREPAFVAHRDRCHAGCTEAWWRAQRLERRLDNALSIEAPPNLAERVLLAHSTLARARARRRWQGFAIAASLLIVLGLGTFAIDRRASADPLPAMSVAHLAGEAGALARTQPLDGGALRAGFAGRGLALRTVPDDAVYVHDCEVGPYRVLHMVFREGAEPVTALYFVDHTIVRARDFHHAGWQGREMPLGHGTLLLLGADARGFAQVERNMRDALQGPAQQVEANARYAMPVASRALAEGEARMPNGRRAREG
ncbi:MAG: DUF3379 family protein [Rhodanobacteraceae bacterium]